MNTPDSSTASTVSPASSAAPTSTRRGRGRPPSRRPLTPLALGHAIELRAQGLPIRSIGVALQKDAQQIGEALRRPENQLEIAKRRELAKQIAAAALPAVIQEGYIMAHESALGRDAKSFDASLRGLHAAEKIAASISGEDRRMEVNHSGAIETQSQSAVEQLKVLLGVVVNVKGT